MSLIGSQCCYCSKTNLVSTLKRVTKLVKSSSIIKGLVLFDNYKGQKNDHIFFTTHIMHWLKSTLIQNYDRNGLIVDGRPRQLLRRWYQWLEPSRRWSLEAVVVVVVAAVVVVAVAVVGGGEDWVANG